MEDKNMDFKGATLQLNSSAGEGKAGPGKDVEYRPVPQPSGPGSPGLTRGGAFNSSRKSTSSTGSKTAVNPTRYTHDFTVESMFAHRPGAFEQALDDCQQKVILNDVDGELHGAWLLTEIDHWDNDHERIVILTDYSLIVVRYDFIATKLKEFKRVGLHLIDKIQIGDLVYPEKSVMPARNHGGVRLVWKHTKEPSLLQKWNPFCNDLPYTTFAHHPLMFNDQERETATYNVDEFYQSLLQAVSAAYRAKRPGEQLRTEELAIVIESYVSLASMVFNQSHIGFNRERGGVSF